MRKSIYHLFVISEDGSMHEVVNLTNRKLLTTAGKELAKTYPGTEYVISDNTGKVVWLTKPKSVR